MPVQDDLRTVTLPRQAGPADPPLAQETPARAAAAPAPRLIGRDRPLTSDERGFALGLVAMAAVLSTYIVTFLLLAEFAWS